MKLEEFSGTEEPCVEPNAPQPVYIWLAGTVRGKGRPRFVRASGRAYTPAQTVSYESALRLMAQMAMDGRPLFTGPVAITVVANFDIPKSYTNKARQAALTQRSKPVKKPDIDNIAKCLDALNGVVWRDDAQITDAVIRKRFSTDPGLAIEVRAA